jgi:hypothetical protein
VTRVAVLLTLSLVCTVALAEEPDPAARREANAFLREGNRLFRAGDAQGALDLFRRAYERLPSPRVLVNVATALGELHRDVEAADAYARVLAAPAGEIPDDMRREVESALAAVEARLGKVRVTVNADGAALTIDGDACGTSPLAAPVRVAPGHHVVRAALEGGPPVEAAVDVAAGETASVSLAPSTAPVAAPTPATSQPDLSVSPETAAPAVPRPEPQRTEASGSIWGRWWLWAGVGAVAAGGVVAAVLLSSGGSDSGEPTELGTVP